MVDHWNDLNGCYDSLSDPSLLEEEEDSEFLEWIELEGSERIGELSRQLNTFFNYKNSIIRLRFSGSQEVENISKKVDIMIKVKKINDIFSQYESLLEMIGIGEEPLMDGIKYYMVKVLANPNALEANLLKKIKKLGDELWMRIQEISTFELHHQTSILYKAISIAEVLSNVQSAFFYPFASFYGELKENYTRLEKELSGLLPSNDLMQGKVKKIKKKVKILE